MGLVGGWRTSARGSGSALLEVGVWSRPPWRVGWRLGSALDVPLVGWRVCSVVSSSRACAGCG